MKQSDVWMGMNPSTRRTRFEHLGLRGRQNHYSSPRSAIAACSHKKTFKNLYPNRIRANKFIRAEKSTNTKRMEEMAGKLQREYASASRIFSIASGNWKVLIQVFHIINSLLNKSYRINWFPST